MKRCKHTHWLSLCRRSGQPILLRSDRLQTLVDTLPHPDVQRPSLLVLIGNIEKSTAMRILYGLKNSRKCSIMKNPGEIHLHLDPSTVFTHRPILLANCDLRKHSQRWVDNIGDKCHETAQLQLHQLPAGEMPMDNIYTNLLSPIADVFCFFSDDLGGFRQIARRLAQWLEKGHKLTFPKTTLPSVIIVTSKFSSKGEAEEEARRAFLWMLGEETTVDLYQQISSIDVVALPSSRTISTNARYRRLKEHIMTRSDQLRKHREDSRVLFSATHFNAFLNEASVHFANFLNIPFDFIKASRAHNPVAPDWVEHLSSFLKHITSSNQLMEFAAPMLASSLLLDNYPPNAHVFDASLVFNTLYKPLFHQGSETRVITLDETNDVILRSGLIAMVETHLLRYFKQLTSGKTAAEIHRDNLRLFQSWWQSIQSSSTCLCCLRRRPQYGLPCGHCICENCVLVFGECDKDDPWLFHVHYCFLCGQVPSTDIAVRVHPPTAGAGVLCIDGGGTRGIVPLALMKEIQDRIGLPIPLQRFIKVAFGVSIGAVIAMDHYINGRALSDSIQRFPGMMERVFKRRTSLGIPFLSRAVELSASYLADGLYSANNIESVLKEALGADKSILDFSYATLTGTKVGLPVATVSRHPSYRIFTNYNGVGMRGGDQGELLYVLLKFIPKRRKEKSIIKPKDGAGNIPLWEIARAVSAAPCFFSPKHINEVGTFQDPGLLENDPLHWALSEVSALFPFPKEPDFVISLGTGEPEPSNYDISTDDCRSILKNGMIRRLCDLVIEKTRDKTIRRIYKSAGLAGEALHRIHRLSVNFHAAEPRLDDIKSIPELISKVQTDLSLSPKIDAVAHCMVASLFYFELDSLPRKCEEGYVLTGHILCSIRRNDPALEALLSKLASSCGRFLVNGLPIHGKITDSSFLGRDGNVRIRASADTVDRLTISLELGNTEAYNISGSPFSVPGLVTAQGLDAPFGRSDHRKRKGSEEDEALTKKRRRYLT